MLALGMAVSVSRDPAAGTLSRMLMLGGGLSLAAGFGLVPGAIARGKNLANASGLTALGLVGVLMPALWLVALEMALVGAARLGRVDRGRG